MKRSLLLTLAIGLASALLYAGPAKRVPVKRTQADGTVVTVLLTGDEHFHFHTTEDGIPVCEAENGSFYYARLADGKLTPTAQLVHPAEQRTATETEFLKTNRLNVQDVQQIWSDKLAAAKAVQRVKAKSPAQRASAFEGTKRALLILVNFADTKMASTSTKAKFEEMMNTRGTKINGNYGSVRDYFYDQSYGKLDMEFDVVGPVNLTRNMSYYGADSGTEGNDVRPEYMVAEACKAVDGEVDFSKYDWDGDGQVDQIYVIYAGYSQASGADTNTIWPHRYWLQYRYGYLALDGVQINSYACSSELNGTSGTKMAGIGPMCHEYSHCFDLPDFYDTNYGGNWGMDNWDIMDTGAYGGDGYVPAPYTSYERMFCGWLTPTVLDSPITIQDMKPITDEPEAYIIYNDRNKDEYYLLENHQQKGWDSYSDGHGMLVLHVTYSQSAWDQNAPNNGTPQRMTIIPADNQFASGNYYGQTYTLPTDRAGDPYPGTKRNKSLTDTSTPAAKLNTANSDGRKYMGKPIENITESSDGLITFDFMGGNTTGTPLPLEATNISDTGFTANWTAVEGASSYNLKVFNNSLKNPTPYQQVLETFDNVQGSGNGADGITNIAAVLDTYLSQTGWAGTYIYGSDGRVRIGKSTLNGSLITPSCNAPADGNVTVRLLPEQYSSYTDVETKVSILTGNNQEFASQTISANTGTYYVHFTDVAATYKVGIYPSKRIYVTEMGVYNGDFSELNFTDEALNNSAGADTPVVSANNISGTSYAVAGLRPGFEYSYMVQAIGAEGLSLWSKAMPVQLTTGISTLRPAVDPTLPVEIYTPEGRYLGKRAARAAKNGLPAGIYLFRQGAKTEKVLVK